MGATLYRIAKHAVGQSQPPVEALPDLASEAIIASWKHEASVEQAMRAASVLKENHGVNWLACGCQEDASNKALPILVIRRSPGSDDAFHLHRPPKRPGHHTDCPFHVSTEDHLVRRERRPDFAGDHRGASTMDRRLASDHGHETDLAMSRRLLWLLHGAGLLESTREPEQRPVSALIKANYQAVRQFASQFQNKGLSINDLLIMGGHYLYRNGYRASFFAIKHKTPSEQRPVAYLIGHAYRLFESGQHATDIEINAFRDGHQERVTVEVPIRIAITSGVIPGTGGPYLVMLRITESEDGSPKITKGIALPIMSITDWMPACHESERIAFKKLNQIRLARQKHGGDVRFEKPSNEDKSLVHRGFILDTGEKRARVLVTDEVNQSIPLDTSECQAFDIHIPMEDQERMKQGLENMWKKVIHWSIHHE